ncbi:unnamed protein product [Gongylonema pulchrum]|uniref:Transcriptional regulator n=1 Tax=Gongylonema pulchrum TaxID=637853 RepID=A0A183E3D9_9BILA|nr:unnamed protein product [Gongylonema pulchrum]VDN32665.1 unnamed protein product [Gongylonema pulchrum]
MCYSEYVALSLFEGYYLHQFDRFCAYAADCEQRGLQNQCLSMDELDAQVLATFVAKINTNGYKKSDVKYSR